MKFEWTEECQKAFDELKKIVISKPIIYQFDQSKETLLYTDASNVGIGGVVCQVDENGIERPLGYFSRGLTDVESRLSTYDLKFLAAKSAMIYFDDILRNVKFTLVVDNSALSTLGRRTDLSKRLFRTFMDLEEYDYSVRLVPSSKNFFADFLSRHPPGRRMIDEKYTKPEVQVVNVIM